MALGHRPLADEPIAAFAASGGGTTAGIGSSIGTSTVTAVGQSLVETIGSISGVSTVLATGQSLWDALGQAVGSSTVLGEDLSGSASDGSSTGSSTVAGFGSSLWEAVGTSTGVAAVTAILEAFFEATGSAVGTATVSGVGSTPSTGTGTLDQATIDAIATAVWAQILDAGITAEGLIRIIAAHAAGSATGLENGSPVFKSLDGTKNRITGTYVAGTRTVTGRDAT